MTEDAILITGPTASGKSALAIKWARETKGVVINADSMQVYDTLRILTARPSDEDMQGIPHHLYGHVPADTAYSTGLWLKDISALLKQLKRDGVMPVIVGGTGLYFRALTEGLSDMPEVPDDLRQSLRARMAEEGSAALHAELQDVDPETAARLQPGDGQRILRALEIHAVSGKPLSSFQNRPGRGVLRADACRKIVVLPDRTMLAERIDRRFRQMLETGAIEEAKTLLSRHLSPQLPVMKAIGVPEIASLLAGDMTMAEVIERGSAATRQYAKRQMTWFRNQMDESWERINPA